VRAVDTNVLVRYSLRDDASRAWRAEKLLAAGDVFVPKTVVLELAWVLRSVAEQPASRVNACLAHLIALPGITIEDQEQVETALGVCAEGVDFADALHHAASHACSELLSFDDRRYARRAARLGLDPPVRLLTD